MFSATPMDLIYEQDQRRQRLALGRYRPASTYSRGQMVVGSRGLMLVAESAENGTVRCVWINRTGTLGIHDMPEDALVPMSVHFGVRSIWPKEAAVGFDESGKVVTLTARQEREARREARRKKAMKPKPSKRIKSSKVAIE